MNKNVYLVFDTEGKHSVREFGGVIVARNKSGNFETLDKFFYTVQNNNSPCDNDIISFDTLIDIIKNKVKTFKITHFVAYNMTYDRSALYNTNRADGTYKRRKNNIFSLFGKKNKNH